MWAVYKRESICKLCNKSQSNPNRFIVSGSLVLVCDNCFKKAYINARKRRGLATE